MPVRITFNDFAAKGQKYAAKYRSHVFRSASKKEKNTFVKRNCLLFWVNNELLKELGLYGVRACVRACMSVCVCACMCVCM